MRMVAINVLLSFSLFLGSCSNDEFAGNLTGSTLSNIAYAYKSSASNLASIIAFFEKYLK